MNVRRTALAAALFSCSTPVWAITSNVDVYGVMNGEVGLPTYETYSAATDVGTNFFSVDPTYTQLMDITATPGAAAQINGSGYTASASTILGSNHAYTSASALPFNVFGVGSFSGWYDTVTINGGSGTGTAYFTVQLNGTVDVGAMAGGLGYTLGTSSVHPSQLTSSLQYFNAFSSPQSWPMDAVNPIATYLLGASPYNDTSILFADTQSSSTGEIPLIPDPSLSLGDAGMGFPTYNLVLTPGAGQGINVTLHGTLNFTYGEAFYLIGGLGTTVTGGEPFCAVNIVDCLGPTKDGTGATTLDFYNSANLVNIALPEGASASFTSGATYNVTAVPEPGEWMMLLAGLGLVGWRARRKAT